MQIIIMGVFVALISLPAYAFPSVVSGSYYHDRSEGRRMACGGRFDSDKLTAASNHHPCGSKVLVKYGAREVVVDVTDRCGHCGIDLSRSAARELGLIQVGRAPVSVERVSAQPDGDPSDAAASDVPLSYRPRDRTWRGRRESPTWERSRPIPSQVFGCCPTDGASAAEPAWAQS